MFGALFRFIVRIGPLGGLLLRLGLVLSLEVLLLESLEASESGL